MVVVECCEQTQRRKYFNRNHHHLHQKRPLHAAVDGEGGSLDE